MHAQSASLAEGIVIAAPDLADGKPVYAFPPTAILEVEHVAAWLRIGIRKADELPLEWSYLGSRTKRILAAKVIAYLDLKAK